MDKKYIIKNCPCRMERFEDDCFGHTGYYNCVACTDCLLKQVVEKCKERHIGYMDEAYTKDDILQLFEIEEVD